MDGIAHKIVLCMGIIWKMIESLRATFASIHHHELSSNENKTQKNDEVKTQYTKQRFPFLHIIRLASNKEKSVVVVFCIAVTVLHIIKDSMLNNIEKSNDFNRILSL